MFWVFDECKLFLISILGPSPGLLTIFINLIKIYKNKVLVKQKSWFLLFWHNNKDEFSHFRPNWWWLPQHLVDIAHNSIRVVDIIRWDYIGCRKWDQLVRKLNNKIIQHLFWNYRCYNQLNIFFLNLINKNWWIFLIWELNAVSFNQGTCFVLSLPSLRSGALFPVTCSLFLFSVIILLI